MQEENLEFWNKVEKTDPSLLKKINGTKLHSIDAYSQIKNATKHWGMYGETWGFSEMKIEYDLADQGLVVFNAKFYYPEGEFPIMSSITIKEGRGLDTDFAKKVQTDALTKALSLLGFNADVFLGKHDGNKYDKKEGSGKEAVKKKQLTSEMYNELKEGEHLPNIVRVLTGGEYKLTPSQRRGLNQLKIKLTQSE